jgi:hypothetical protein
MKLVPNDDKSAGQKLREELDEDLARIGRRLGQTLHWNTRERAAIAAAAEAADLHAELQAMLAAELANERRPAEVVRMMTETRQLRRMIAVQLDRLNFAGQLTAKSRQHQEAANTRWTRVQRREFQRAMEA